ncbi:DNA-binding transcriptional regulator, MarR family [Thermostaphylospora chromogena]|uniref:DNA-binding transcriptional regulator, MarR family n=1 Tax=Thermostaphylospora chromogena TaxID=35622 RepID=A0A1H1EW21_9ACTN|nr:DNA-binding transcriptional regulator, MarR family [Thermostaphylospora chromogena]
MLAPYGLTLRQLGLLLQLRAEPELTTAELARQLGVSRQTLHQMVGELERAGHVRRGPGASGRTRRLVLTPGAARLAERARTALAEAETSLTRGADPREARILRTLLARLLARVTDDEAWLSAL